MAGTISDYDKVIEVKKKELAKIEKQIIAISAERDKIIKEGNQIIYDNKAKAEKIIADANAKAEGIVAEASKIKTEADTIKAESVKRSAELDEKEKIHREACKVTVRDQEKLAQDKIDFGKQKKEQLAKAEVILASARELVDVIAGLGRTVNVKIAEITKL